MWTYNTLIVLVGASLLGALCGVVGSFAVLRRRALLGDALAHAALPGLALAFWITGSRSLPVLLTGAGVTGLLGIWFIAAVRKHTRTREDAALGLVLSVLFGAGIAISRYVQNAVPDGSKAGLDTFIFGKTAGIVKADVIGIAVVCLISLLIVIVAFKEFRLLAFDPEFAATQGYRVVFLDLVLMGLIVLAVVVGLPMVGIVMVAALTILPAAAARFWTSQLSWLLVLAAGIGVVSTASGALISASEPGLPTGPVMILVAGTLFGISACFAPHRGYLSDRQRRSRVRWTYAERVGLQVFDRNERVDPAMLVSVGIRRPDAWLARAREQGWVVAQGDQWQITDSGRAQLVNP